MGWGGILMGAFIGLSGVGLMTAGVVWKGRAARPFAASRARTMARREYVRHLSPAGPPVRANRRSSPSRPWCG